MNDYPFFVLNNKPIYPSTPIDEKTKHVVVSDSTPLSIPPECETILITNHTTIPIKLPMIPKIRKIAFVNDKLSNIIEVVKEGRFEVLELGPDVEIDLRRIPLDLRKESIVDFLRHRTEQLILSSMELLSDLHRLETPDETSNKKLLMIWFDQNAPLLHRSNSLPILNNAANRWGVLCLRGRIEYFGLSWLPDEELAMNVLLLHITNQETLQTKNFQNPFALIWHAKNFTVYMPPSPDLVDLLMQVDRDQTPPKRIKLFFCSTELHKMSPSVDIMAKLSSPRGIEFEYMYDCNICLSS